MASASPATAASTPPPDGNDTTSPPPTTPPKEILPSPPPPPPNAPVPPPPVVTPNVTPIGAIRSSPPPPAFISLVESPAPPAVAPIAPRISPPPPATLRSPVKSPPPPPDPLFEFAPPPPIMPIDFPPPGPPRSSEPGTPPSPPAKPFVSPPPPLPSSELIPPFTPPPPVLANGSSSETIIPSTASSSHTPLAILVGLSVGIGVSAILLLTILFICHRKMKNRGSTDYYYKTPPKDNWHDHYLKQRFPSPGTRLMAMLANPFPPPFPPPQLGSNGDSCSNNSVSENHFSPPSHGIPLGLSGGMFTFEELAAATHGFSKANLLGEGGFGYVYKGILPNRREIAVKQLKMGSRQGEREFQAEVDTISRVHHRHLVTLVGYCSTGAERLLVYEFVKNKTLEFHLHKKGQPLMEWATRLKIAIGSAKGLAYLHEDCNPTIIHRDIKGANILLDSKFEAKVSDFGLAKFFSDADHLITHVSTRVVGTFGYLAPEYASTGKASDKSDVFSYGVVLLELITGRQPIDNTAESFTSENLVYWARPLLTKALEDGNYDALVDPRLQRDYNTKEMAHMVACAAACVRHSAWLRPRLSQIVRALEGDISLMDLDDEGIRPGHSRVCGSFPNYGMEQFLIDINKFDMKLGTQENGFDWYSENTRNNGLHPPTASSMDE